MNMLSKGERNYAEIARVLHVDKSCVSRDVAFMRQEFKNKLQTYLDELLSEEYELCLVGLNEILANAWILADLQNDKTDAREKIAAMTLLKDTYEAKLDLLSHSTVVNKVVKFITSAKENLKLENNQQPQQQQNMIFGDESKEQTNDIKRSEEKIY